MSVSSTASLGALRLFSQQRASLVNSPNITIPEWNQNISDSYKELYDLLVGAYGNDYYCATPFQMTMTASTLYALPGDFYKLLGVDLQYSASPTGWVSLKRFEFLERNKFGYLTPAINTIAQVAQIWYVPVPTALQFTPSCSTTLNSAVITADDVESLTTGMSVSGSGIPNNTLINSINTGTNEITLSNTASATQVMVPVQFWKDSVRINGISGWEQYIVVDAAIKALIHEESDITSLLLQKKGLLDRIEAMAEGRDAGQASHTTDALSINSWGYNMLGAANLRYHLLGDNLQLVPCASDMGMDGYGDCGFGGGW